MKIALITLYDEIEGKVEFFNGFSFVKTDGDHIFLQVGKKVTIPEKYDRILCSVSHRSDLLFVKDICDSRWVFGGPIVRHYSKEYLRKYFPNMKFYMGSIEEYLDIEREDIFIEYWKDWIFDYKPICFGYNASCGSDCYWGKCIFCRVSGHKNDSRDIGNVFGSLPEYDFLTHVHFRSGSMTPEELKYLINCQERKPKKNTVFRIYLRGEKEILDIIKTSDDLSYLFLIVGLEGFTQMWIDSLNKNLEIKTILETGKIASEKGASICFSLMSMFPLMDNKIYNESLKTIDWIGDNLDPKKVHFYDSIYTNWLRPEVANSFGAYKIKDIGVFSLLTKEKKEMCTSLITKLQEKGFKVPTYPI